MAHGGSTPLLFAARTGDVDTARALVDAGADVNDIAGAGTSALVIAAHSGHSALAIYLVEQGADPNAADAGYTALHAAILRSDVALVREQLRHGANPDAVVEHGTPGRRYGADYSIRHQAVGAKRVLARLILGRGVDVNASDARGNTALHDAVRRRFTSVVEFLSENGADLNAANKDGATPLMLAESQRLIYGTTTILARVTTWLIYFGALARANLNSRRHEPIRLESDAS